MTIKYRTIKLLKIIIGSQLPDLYIDCATVQKQYKDYNFLQTVDVVQWLKDRNFIILTILSSLLGCELNKLSSNQFILLAFSFEQMYVCWREMLFCHIHLEKILCLITFRQIKMFAHWIPYVAPLGPTVHYDAKAILSAITTITHVFPFHQCNVQFHPELSPRYWLH